MRLLPFLFPFLMLFIGCNSLSKILPTEELESALVKRDWKYKTVMISKWEAGRHVLFQIPPEGKASKSVRKITFFYYNEDNPLDSVRITDLSLSEHAIIEANRLLSLLNDSFNKLPQLKSGQQVFVVGGTTYRMILEGEMLAFDNLCSTIDLRHEVGESTGSHCQFVNYLRELLKLLMEPIDESCSC